MSGAWSLVRRAGFWLACAAFLLAGLGLRLAPRSAAQPPSGASASAALSARMPWREAPEAVEVVLAFYRQMGDGDYAAACAQAIELSWDWPGEGLLPRAVGVKPPDECIATSRSEAKTMTGSYVLYSIEAAAMPPPSDSPPPPELIALLTLKDAPPVSALSWVRAQGTVRMACTVFDWQRDLVVVRSEGVWRLLVPPPTQYSRLRILGWFSPPDRALSPERP